MTSPTAKARIVSPTSMRGQYVLLSAIHPRMAGSTDKYALRTRNSPSFGAGIGAVRIAKSSERGMPLGRDFSHTWRLTWLLRMVVRWFTCFSQEAQSIARQEEVARRPIEIQRVQPLQRRSVLDHEGMVRADAQLGRTEGGDQMRQGRRVVHQRVVEHRACLLHG